ncbi:hypothetical protein CCYN49044_10035 [Capnocytophaga cynodegmi]|uniref:Uncharacterized protein n=1 Tax=Capnocytophaga cynodegmi TaxID=28189 RepID=A0A0B7H8Y0_9FLAO|nr:hypothetical protein CCYN49044_10035 [Capnocytophaga cynodegmi]CEN41805.1 hypothetical protein CCYN74_80036 [Capnocytophaga cynodegmi]
MGFNFFFVYNLLIGFYVKFVISKIDFKIKLTFFFFILDKKYIFAHNGNCMQFSTICIDKVKFLKL